MKRILATMLLVCVVVSGVVMLSSCEKNEFTSMIPGLNATMDMIEELTHVHKLELVEQVNPTCDEVGTKSYYACKGCEALFADEKGEMVITSPDLIERLSHQYDNDYDADCNLCAAVRVPKCRHANTVILTEKKVSCTESGLTEGEKCNDCGEIIVKQETIEAPGHKFDDDTDATCNNCSYERCFHVSTEAAGEASESTCTVQGLTAGKKCSDCGEILEAQEKLPLADHTEVATDEVAAGCLTTGLTAGTKCSVCETVIKAPETVKAAGHKWTDISCTSCGAVKFEAEDSVIVTDIDRLGAGMQEGKTPESTNYPSGDGYVYYLTDSGNATLTFAVNSSKAGKAVLSFCVGLSNKYNASQLFKITVNDKTYDCYADAVIPSYDSVGATRYFGWYELEVADIELKEGANTIVLTRNEKGLNFDYIAIRSTDGATISYVKCTGKHTYGDWSVTKAPTLKVAGELGTNCKNCGEYKSAVLPVISTENGYIETNNVFTSIWKYTYEGKTFEFEVDNAKTYSFAVTNGGSPFTSVVDNNGDTDGTIGINENQYGIFYQKTKGATFTMKVNVEEATTVKFIIMVCSNKDHTHAYNKAITSVTSTNSSGNNNVVIHDGTVAPKGWYTKDAVGIEIATISLAKGTNTITFTMGTETSKDLNIAAINFEAVIPVTLSTNE